MTTLAQPATSVREEATVVGLVGLAHGISHFSQLLLAPLFPWLKDEFVVSYAQLGFLLTIFFTVSCVVQAASGFWVDRYGPRPILLAGLAMLGLAAFGFAASTGYWMLAAFSVLAGAGNGVFHPVDYTLINRKVGKARLGHAYSVHGITGSLGWALAPAMLVPLTMAYSWRVALVCAGALAFAVLALLLWRRADLDVPRIAAPAPAVGMAGPEHVLAFLRLPAVWVCFGFFFFYAGALSVVQTFATQAASALHGVPPHLAAICLSVYMVCSAGGMVVGGFLVVNPERCERIVGASFGVAACIALVIGLGSVPALAVPVLFGLMGVASGITGPSRDLLVKRSTPEHATGRVYGVVYSGLDIGQAVVPLFVGALMDQGAYRGVWLALVLLQGVLILSAFGVGRVRPDRPASA
jgi:FSR family fosmidomycin resistance protein-like MFS transporter